MIASPVPFAMADNALTLVLRQARTLTPNLLIYFI